MRICATCGRQWDGTIELCPLDGTALAPATAAAIAHGPLAVAAAPEELAEGAMVGEYRVEQPIGVGGMGVVYGARHPVIGKRAAVKVLNAKYSADHEAVSRFVQEAQAVNRIGHANIVDIFALGTLDDGRCYFVMEWLQGETLGQRLAGGPLPIPDALSLLTTLTRALDAAHAAGVVHRDLKPENVFLVREDDETIRVKLLDFGIAKLSTSAAPETSKTATGMTLGTPMFMSPEQARGMAIDGRTDIYSLGVLAYAMVCGETPFEHEPSAIEVMSAHILKDPVPPMVHRPDVPPTLDTLILEMLAKTADERPTLVDIRRRLSALATPSAPVAVQVPVTGPNEIGSPRPRRPAKAVALVLAVLAVAGAATVILSRRAGDEPAARVSATPHVVAATAAAPSRGSPSPATVTPASASPPPSTSPVSLPAPSTGSLDLRIEPAGAVVMVDGSAIALEHGHVRLDLGPGPHSVSGRAPGYRALDQTIAVSADKSTVLALRLVRARASTAVKPTHPDADGVVNPFKH